jgi:hypothetical protein
VTRLLRRPAALVCLLVAVLQVFLPVALVRDPDMGEPHQVPLTIAAPGVRNPLLYRPAFLRVDLP